MSEIEFLENILRATQIIDDYFENGAYYEAKYDNQDLWDLIEDRLKELRCVK